MLAEKDFWDLTILIEIPESSGAAGPGEESSGKFWLAGGWVFLKMLSPLTTDWNEADGPIGTQSHSENCSGCL